MDLQRTAKQSYALINPLTPTDFGGCSSPQDGTVAHCDTVPGHTAGLN